MITGIIVAHGNLAEELLSTARMIFGEFTDVHSMSNAQKSPQALTEDLDAIVVTALDAGAEGVVILTDFFGGSSFLSAGNIVAGNRSIHGKMLETTERVFDREEVADLACDLIDM